MISRGWFFRQYRFARVMVNSKSDFLADSSAILIFAILAAVASAHVH